MQRLASKKETLSVAARMKPLNRPVARRVKDNILTSKFHRCVKRDSNYRVGLVSNEPLSDVHEYRVCSVWVCDRGQDENLIILLPTRLPC